MRYLPLAGTICVLLAGCQPAAVPPAVTQPAASTPHGGSPAQPSPPGLVPSLQGTASVKGQPVPDAIVALVLGRTGVVPADAALAVATGVTTDAAGRFVVPLPETLAPDSPFLIAASKGDTTLYSLPLLAPAAAAIPVDLPSTVVAKTFTPRLVELALSGPESPAARDRLRAAVDQVAGLRSTLATVLGQPPKDAALLGAYAGIGAEPTRTEIETLANLAMAAADLRPAVGDVADSLQEGVVRNMLDGGSLFRLSPWLAGVEIPVVVRDGSPFIRFKGQTNPVAASATALSAGLPVPAMIDRLNALLGNVFASTVGGVGGGGGGGGASVTLFPPLPNLAGTAL